MVSDKLNKFAQEIVFTSINLVMAARISIVMNDYNLTFDEVFSMFLSNDYIPINKKRVGSLAYRWLDANEIWLDDNEKMYLNL